MVLFLRVPVKFNGVFYYAKSGVVTIVERVVCSYV